MTIQEQAKSYAMSDIGLTEYEADDAVANFNWDKDIEVCEKCGKTEQYAEWELYCPACAIKKDREFLEKHYHLDATKLSDKQVEAIWLVATHPEYLLRSGLIRLKSKEISIADLYNIAIN